MKIFQQKTDKKFGGNINKQYLCTAILSYGVMVAQQVLVLFAVVRIRLGQQKCEKVLQKFLLKDFFYSLFFIFYYHERLCGNMEVIKIELNTTKMEIKNT